jgi:hypothetical protein
MLAYLILAKLTICPGPHTVLAVSERGVPVLVASNQIHDLPYLRAVKHFPEVQWPPIGIESVKPQRPAKPISYFETTDVYKVWYVIPPRDSPKDSQ